MRSFVAAAISVLLGLCGCGKPPPGLYLDPNELRNLVTSRTLYVPPTESWPYATQLYLDPRGTGWMDSRVDAARLPLPGSITAVLSWQVIEPSWICAWTTPTLGEMASMTPPHRECLQVLRSPTVPVELNAYFAREDRGVVAPIEFQDGNAFPASRIASFNESMRALFGGHFPTWDVPPTFPPPGGS